MDFLLERKKSLVKMCNRTINHLTRLNVFVKLLDVWTLFLQCPFCKIVSTVDHVFLASCLEFLTSAPGSCTVVLFTFENLHDILSICYFICLQEHFQKQRIENSMGSSEATSKQVDLFALIWLILAPYLFRTLHSTLTIIHSIFQYFSILSLQDNWEDT